VSTGREVALVLRALGLGDLLAAVPALRGVRRALPGHHLALATDPALAGLVGLVGGVDELVPARGLEPLDVQHRAIDVAVDLHGKGPLSQPVLQALQPRRLVAFGCAEIGVDGPQWRRDEHEVRRWCRLVGEGLGVATDPADLALPVPPTTPTVSDAVVVHPGAAFGARRWPAERFAAVAAKLTRRGEHVVITGSGTERELAARVASQAGLSPAAVLAGRTDVLELAAVVAAARLVVTGDTGTAHLASAFRTPSVVLFGPTPPAWWGPPPGPHVVLWHGTEPGDPWGDLPDPALLRISVDEVLKAVGGLQGSTSAALRQGASA
jgi:ADP-heptose:LPS heptosyltransferase